MVEPGRPKMTWCMRFACWITKAINLHSEYVTLIVFSFRRPRLNVTLYVHCLSCFLLEKIPVHWNQSSGKDGISCQYVPHYKMWSYGPLLMAVWMMSLLWYLFPSPSRMSYNYENISCCVMGVKLDLSHCSRNISWRCSRIVCWGIHLGLRGTR